MSAFRVDYGRDVEAGIAVLVDTIEAFDDVAGRYDARWLAVALLDEDPDIERALDGLEGGAAVLSVRDEQLATLRRTLGTSVETAIAGARFQTVNDLAAAVSSTTVPCSVAPAVIRTDSAGGLPAAGIVTSSVHRRKPGLVTATG